MLWEGLEGIWGHLGGFWEAFGGILEALGGSWVAFGDIWDPLGPPQGARTGEGRLNPCPRAPHEAQVNKIAINQAC